MFERYTERARRVIFFGRYEASQFGSTTIETEHLLLALLREDRNLARHFLPDDSAIESICTEIKKRATIREKTSTSIDLPLSNECKRILAYAAEEAERLNYPHIGSEHLWLGIVREEKCLAATVLHERGLRLHEMREKLARSAGDWQAPVLSDTPAFTFGSAEVRGMGDIQPTKHIPQERAYQIANGSPQDVDPEEYLHLMDCEKCGKNVIRLVGERRNKRRLRKRAGHIAEERLQVVAASDTLVFTVAEFVHMGSCPECFAIWKRMIKSAPGEHSD